jgi:hypothetical protein
VNRGEWIDRRTHVHRGGVGSEGMGNRTRANGTNLRGTTIGRRPNRVRYGSSTSRGRLIVSTVRVTSVRATLSAARREEPSGATGLRSRAAAPRPCTTWRSVAPGRGAGRWHQFRRLNVSAVAAGSLVAAGVFLRPTPATLARRGSRTAAWGGWGGGGGAVVHRYATQTRVLRVHSTRTNRTHARSCSWRN